MGKEQQQEITVAAPTGGWNKRDALGTMDQSDAIVMDNFVSTGGFVKTRGGFRIAVDTEKATGFGLAVETLSAYVHGTTNELIFVRNEHTKGYHIYATTPDIENPPTEFKDITPADSTEAGLETGMYKDLMFQGYLFFVSKGLLVPPMMYNGTKFAWCNFTGVGEGPAFNLNAVCDICSYKKRLFMIEEGTMNLWFTDRAGNIQGVVDSIDISEYAQKGGSLIGIAEWSRTGADNMSSVLIVLSSEGEIFMFSGLDPYQAEDWKLEGIYQVPTPVGFRCITKLGSDLIIATRGGYYKTSTIVGSVGEVDKVASITDKIRGAISGLKGYHKNIGWQVAFLPAINFLMINIPLDDNKSQQFALNLENNTWSRFTGIHAVSFISFGEEVYFGGKRGGIFRLFSGGSDFGVQINATCQQAFSTFDNPKMKHVKSLTMMVGTAYAIPIKVLLSADFNVQTPGCVVVPSGKNIDEQGALWDQAVWDKSFWGSSLRAEDLDIQPLTTMISNTPSRYYSIGIQISPAVEKDNDIVWYSTVYSYEQEL